MSLLKLQRVGLQLSRSPKPQLSQISFELHPGDFVVLYGPTNSGKTLLLRLINGLRSPSQGEILWQNAPLDSYKPVELRRQIAWLPSQPQLLGMTVAEAIAYPLQLQGLSSTAIQPRLSTWLETLAIPSSALQQRANELSPELTQQVALARAMILEPQLLLLDDPWPNDPWLQPSLSPEQSTSQASPLAQLPQALEAPLAWLQKRDTAILWARQSCRPIAKVQRLLHLEQGRLRQDGTASLENWQRLEATEQPTAPSDTYRTEPEESWD